MQYSSFIQTSRNINSVIDNGLNLVEAFNKVLLYFDPNKSKNYKTTVLDCSHSYMWTQNDIKLFNVDRTKNLTGTVSKKQFDIIIYEPPRNSNFYQDSINSSKVFSNLLKRNGIIIVKMNDFKEKGSSQLKGSFEVWENFSNNKFFLFDNIIYNFHKTSHKCETYDRSKIIHLYFMIFKNQHKS